MKTWFAGVGRWLRGESMEVSLGDFNSGVLPLVVCFREQVSEQSIGFPARGDEDSRVAQSRSATYTKDVGVVLQPRALCSWLRNDQLRLLLAFFDMYVTTRPAMQY